MKVPTLCDPVLDPVHDPRAAGSSPRWHRLAPRLPTWLHDMAAFCAALLCAGLAALLIGVIGGCGGGVGSEGTGSYASGPISGFGSIIVNGVHFEESAAQVQDDDGQTLAGSALALGMVVQVTAGPVSTAADGSRRAVASAVRTSRSLVGPASAVGLASGQLLVLGQKVWVSGDTVFDARLAGGLAGIASGQLLEVYGFYDSTRVAYTATRINPAATSAGLRVSGPVAALDPRSQTFSVGSQTYSFAALGTGVSPSEGEWVRLNLQPEPDSGGRWVVSGQRASDSAPKDRDGAGLDGVVSARLSGNRFVVDGVTVDASAAQVSGTVAVGAEVEVSGSLRAGVLVAAVVKVSGDQARSFDLEGSPTALDSTARRFLLRGVTVSYARSGLVFENGSAATLVGYTGKLHVEGVLSADRTLLEATRIHFDK